MLSSLNRLEVAETEKFLKSIVILWFYVLNFMYYVNFMY